MRVFSAISCLGTLFSLLQCFLSECLVIATDAKVPTLILWTWVWISATLAGDISCYGFWEHVDKPAQSHSTLSVWKVSGIFAHSPGFWLSSGNEDPNSSREEMGVSGESQGGFFRLFSFRVSVGWLSLNKAQLLSGSPCHFSFSKFWYVHVYQFLINVPSPGTYRSRGGVSVPWLPASKYCITSWGFSIHLENSTFSVSPHIKGKTVTKFLKYLMVISRKLPPIISQRKSGWTSVWTHISEGKDVFTFCTVNSWHQNKPTSHLSNILSYFLTLVANS